MDQRRRSRGQIRADLHAAPPRIHVGLLRAPGQEVSQGQLESRTVPVDEAARSSVPSRVLLALPSGEIGVEPVLLLYLFRRFRWQCSTTLAPVAQAKRCS